MQQMFKKLRRAAGNVLWSLSDLDKGAQGRYMSEYHERASKFVDSWGKNTMANHEPDIDSENPLRAYFNSIETGNGIWKWWHYFDIYHKHLQKFRGKPINILEIGVFSGGSMRMWRNYFGPECVVYGIDIFEECKAYEEPGINIFIGDQADRTFWKNFKADVPKIDVLIDDGGHTPEQQIVTLEEMLPFISPGGVYICEDIHGRDNLFGDYINGLQKALHGFNETRDGGLASKVSAFQSSIESIHIYPYSVVIEKAIQPKTKLHAPKRGTQWQPFYEKKMF